MLPLSSVIIALQGTFGVLNGTASLLFSPVARKNLDALRLSSLPALHAIAMGSITIGAFYINAGLRNDRMAMWMSVLGRAVSIPIFVSHGGPWVDVAVFEAVCGVTAGLALGWESWKTRVQGPTEKRRKD